jgi:hypothetical protein
VALGATAALIALLAALLVRPGTDLEPRRSSVMELDEPAPALPIRPQG